MNSFVSIKQAEAVAVAFEQDALVPLTGLFGPSPVVLADGAGPTADSAGRLLLPAGMYMIGLHGAAVWKWAEEFRIRIVVGGDPRFHAPQVSIEQDSSLLNLLEHVELPRRVERWSGRLQRPFSTFGMIRIPSSSEPVPVEVWGLTGTNKLRVTFSETELIAIALTSTKGTT